MGGSGTSEPFKKKGVDIYSDLYYQLLYSFKRRLYHVVGGSKFNVVDYDEGESEEADLIPSHVWRGTDEENIMYLSMFVVY